MPYVHVNGTKMYYQTKGRGFPLILIHPPLLTSEVFKAQVDQLSEHVQVIVVDLRGHGKSPYSETPLTYSLLSEDIMQLMKLLEIKRAFIGGYSTGGGIALEALLSHPERFYGGILISTMPSARNGTVKRRLNLAILLSALKAKRLLAAAISIGNASGLRSFRRLYRSSMQGSLLNFQQYYRASKMYDVSASLGQIKVPTLLLYGGKDKTFHDYAEEMQRELPEAEIYMFKSAVHHIPIKEPARMNEIIFQWIRKHVPVEAGQEEADGIPEMPVIPVENENGETIHWV